MSLKHLLAKPFSKVDLNLEHWIKLRESCIFSSK